MLVRDKRRPCNLRSPSPLSTRTTSSDRSYGCGDITVGRQVGTSRAARYNMDKIRERVLDGEPSSSTLVAERQVLEFLIGPVQQKQQRKKGRPLKFFTNYYNLTLLIKTITKKRVRASACSRVSPALCRSPKMTRTWGCRPGTHHRADFVRFCLVIIIRSASL
jgi:hypothetical protein